MHTSIKPVKQIKSVDLNFSKVKFVKDNKDNHLRNYRQTLTAAIYHCDDSTSKYSYTVECTQYENTSDKLSAQFTKDILAHIIQSSGQSFNQVFIKDGILHTDYHFTQYTLYGILEKLKIKLNNTFDNSILSSGEVSEFSTRYYVLPYDIALIAHKQQEQTEKDYFQILFSDLCEHYTTTNIDINDMEFYHSLSFSITAPSLQELSEAILNCDSIVKKWLNKYFRKHTTIKYKGIIHLT